MRLTKKRTMHLWLCGIATMVCIACNEPDPAPRIDVVNLHNESAQEPSSQNQEQPSREVVNVSFKGGTEDAKNLAVVFDLKKGKKLDGQRVAPVRVDPHNPVLGPADAPVTWVIFGGWECPFSGRLPPVIDALHKAYPKDLRIVFKHVVPPHAPVGKIAASRLLMAPNQTFWETGMNLLKQSPLTNTVMESHAQLLPLTNEQEKEALIRLDMDQQLAASLQIRSTPQSFINGYRLTGVKPLHAFKESIERELARSKEQGTP